MRLVIGLIAFGGGLAVLVESVEGLVKALRGWAAAAGVSGLALAALVLGADLESTAAGIAATLRDLPGTALGTSIGAVIFLVTAGLGIAALVAPFAVRPPTPLLLACAAATALAIALCADGLVSRVDGAILVAAFVPLAAVFVLAVRRNSEQVERDEAAPRGRLVLRVLAGLAGLLIGAELLVFGTQRTVSELGLSETTFGLIVVAAAVSFEEVVLEALPAFRGFPELSVGNALGTLVFLLTASLGIIALVRPVPVPHSVVAFHLPALGATVVLALGLLARGRLGRAEGALLISAYGVYVAGALLR